MMEDWLRQPARYFPADDARAEREGVSGEERGVSDGDRLSLIEHGKPWTVRNVDGGPLIIRDTNGVEPWLTVGESVEVVPASQLRGAVDLLRWALPYLPEPLPSMDGGAYAENYDRALTLSANTPTGGQ